MAWIYVVAAGFFEIAWAVALKQSAGLTRLGPSLIMAASMFASVGLLSLAMRTLPLGTAYTVWTGIGAIGTFTVGILFMGEQASLSRLSAAVLIIVGITLMRASAI